MRKAAAGNGFGIPAGKRHPAFLFAALFLAILTFADLARSQDQVIDASGVTSAAHDGGAFSNEGGVSWVETNLDGAITFRFRETNRDEWSVYLLDDSRNVNLQIDLLRKLILYADPSNPEYRPLYAITRVEGRPRGAGGTAQGVPGLAPQARPDKTPLQEGQEAGFGEVTWSSNTEGSSASAALGKKNACGSDCNDEEDYAAILDISCTRGDPDAVITFFGLGTAYGDGSPVAMSAMVDGKPGVALNGTVQPGLDGESIRAKLPLTSPFLRELAAGTQLNFGIDETDNGAQMFINGADEAIGALLRTCL